MDNLLKIIAINDFISNENDKIKLAKQETAKETDEIVKMMTNCSKKTLEHFVRSVLEVRYVEVRAQAKLEITKILKQ